VLGVFISEGEFTQISANHIEFDFNDIEGFSIVYSDEVSNHIWHNDGISKMGLDWGWLLSRLSVLFRLFAFHVKTIVFMLDFYI
jgi:hypothetical protein